MRIPSGVTDQVIYFVAVDATDLKTRETGLSSFTVYRSRNGGTAAAMTTPTVTEVDATNMPGVYKLLLDEDMTIDAGDDSQEMVFHITQASMAPVTRVIELYRPKITAGETLTVSSGVLPWNAAWDAEVESECNDALVAIHLDHLLAADYDPASKPGTSTALLNEIVENDGGVSRFTANALEQAPSGGGGGLSALTSGTAQSGTASTIVLAAATAFGDDILNGAVINLTGGTGAGQSRVIIDYVGATDTATVTPNWTTNPSSDTTYEVVQGSVNLTAISNAAETVVVEADLPSNFADMAITVTTGEVTVGTSNDKTGYSISGTIQTLDALENLSTADVDARLAAIGLDHLIANSVIGTDVADNSIIAYLASKSATADWDSFNNTTDSLEAISDAGGGGGGGGLTALASGTAQSGTASTVVLAASTAFADDILNGCVINLTGGTGAGQSRVITDYTGATDTATVSPNWTTNPSSDTTYEVVQGSVNVAAVSSVAEDLPTATALATVDANVDLILADTADMQPKIGTVSDLGGGATLAQNLADMAGATFSTSTDTLEGIYNAVAGLNNLSAAQVNAEVLDVLTTDTFAELGAVPAATSSLKDKLTWVFMLARNKMTQTSTTSTLRNDADSASVSTSAVSDDGTTFTRGEYS